MVWRVLAVVVCAHPVFAQTALEAQEEIGRLRELVEIGAAPRKALESAEKRIEEIRDEQILAGTLYARLEMEELTPESSAAMVAAAERQLERRKLRLAKAQELVEAGAAARTSLSPYLEELDRARRTFDEATHRASLVRELTEMARREAEYEERAERLLTPEPMGPMPVAERFDGDGVFLTAHWRSAVLAYEKQFGRGMPVSAHGETAFHKSLGYDHRGRIDVALDPDSAEGKWLRAYLESMRVPYFAFRGYVRGSATAAHIHIGPPSNRLRRAD
jgi:hypothetical protein